MADKAISALTAATEINDNDVIPIEQSGTAKKVSGEVLTGYAKAAAQGYATQAENAKNAAVAAKESVESTVDNIIDEVTDGVMDEVDPRITAVEEGLEDVAIDPDRLGLYQDPETGLVYVTYDGVASSNGIPLAGGGGGGGGGSGNNAILTVTNENPDGWISKTISVGASCSIALSWSSLENEVETGNGTLTVKLGNTVKASYDVEQGNVTVNVTPYLATGTNKLKITIEDVYGNSRTLAFTVTTVELFISSSFDPNINYTAGEDIAFPYTPVGTGEKTVYFYVDGTQTATATVTASGRQMTQTLAGLTHGAHSIRVYFTASVGGTTVSSNELYYDIIVVGSSTQPIISTPFHQTSVAQYTTLNIPYRVYNPSALTATVDLYVGSTKVNTVTVDRTEQTWVFRPDDVGSTTLHITTTQDNVTVDRQITFTVTETNIDVSAETSDLALYLTSYGRSNNEEHPEVWQDTTNNISATLSGFNWTSDGWVQDSDGVTVLRVAGSATVSIPYKPFQTDFRGTGKTIEIEFATRNVLNYDATVISCMSGGRGFQLTAQKATLSSESSQIGTQYKEDEHVRISFVAEKRSENRLLYIYINGIMSGVVQYPETDDFSQSTPVNISIGSSYCTTDIYCIRIYDNDLTRHQILDNWIADTQSLDALLDRYHHNDVYDEYGSIVISKLPNDLPYLVISCPELPQYKGDKKTVSGYYVDPIDTTKSFSFSGAQADVQGTSSQYYPRKNYKIKFNGGFVMTSSGQTASKFQMRSTSIPTKTFTFKADVASSEGANNVELARLYNDICPYQTPPQEEDSRVRQGIDGFPIVIFWDNGSTVSFVGKYNFNNDKGTEEVFGFASGDESWEIKNNTSNRVLWKSADYTGTDWLSDFEARYPDTDPAYTDSTKLAALAAWLVTTDQSAATGNALATSYTDVDGTVHTVDNAAYRLAKFKTELSDHMEVNSAIFYYLFTELFLMVDSRAKNAFPSILGSDKWCWLPYDFDTAIGINNEGALVFDYSLEDTDHLSGGDDIFNGQQSVMWINLRMAFASQIAAMYQNLRSSGALSYAVVEQAFENHQSKWAEAIFNEDSWFKYIAPFVLDGTDYLDMAQGSKAEQRKWWLYNRFRYIDSKYNAGDALTDVLTIRAYARGNITVTPYADIYPTVKYGSYLVSARGHRNTATTLAMPADLTTLSDTEVYVYSASQIASIGDISPLKVGLVDLSNATKLQYLKCGDSAASYENTRLYSLTLGNNVLLQTIDARNCSGLGDTTQEGHTQTAVDISGCTGIEHVYFDGTKIKALTLPVGGILKTLHLPATITNLTIRNQTAITDFSMPSYANITTLRLENVASTVPTVTILNAIPANSRVRILGLNLTMSTTSAVEDFYDLLDTMRGLDENGNNVDNAVVQGTITGLGTITGSWLAEMQERYPNITIGYQHINSNLYYYNGDTLVNTEQITDGGDGTYAGTPTKTATAQYTYTFVGWSRQQDSEVADPNATKAVVADRNVYAAYTKTLRTYTVTFKNGTTTLQTVQNVPYGGSATYTGETPVDADNGYPFDGWNPEPTNITGDTVCLAQFAEPDLSTITDTWEEILAAEQSGTYSTRYSVGDTKLLQLASGQRLYMQIAAFDADDKADNSGKAKISWISQGLLDTPMRMNPALQTVYTYSTGASWTRNTSSTYYWYANNAHVENNAATISFKLTAVTTGTVRLRFKANSSSYALWSVTINGDPVSVTASASIINYALPISAGNTYSIVVTLTSLSDAYNGGGQLYIADTANSASTANVNALVSVSDIVIEDCTVATVDHYVEGTGNVGGWAKTEVRSYLRDTVKPMIPASVRNAIVEVSKTSMSTRTTGSSATVNITTTDDVWIPTADEVSGASSKYYPLFQNTNSNRRKQMPGSSSSYASWWLMGGNTRENAYYVSTSGSAGNTMVTNEYYIPLCFCT